MVPKRIKQTQKQRDCLHVVSTLGTKRDEEIAGGWRYVCIRCGALQKILSGVLVSDAKAKEILAGNNELIALITTEKAQR